MAIDTAQAGTPDGGKENQPAGGSPEKTFTQEQVNALLAKERRDTEAKFAKYDEYKAANEKAAAADEASKTELQKATDRAANAEKELEALKAKQQQADWIAAIAFDYQSECHCSETIGSRQ